MAQELLVCDPIVQRVALDWRGQGRRLGQPTYLQAVTAVLAHFPHLPAGTVFIIYGRAHKLILPHPANPQRGTRWTPKMAGGGRLDLVLARVNRPAQWVHLAYEAYAEQGEIGVNGPTSWLVTDVNPTTTLTGNNVLPVTIADPQTGEIDEIPSSSPQFLHAVYRMAVPLLEDLARQAGLIRGGLFSRQTLQAIHDGDVHVVRSQWAAYLPCHVHKFLQLLVVLYDQTIAHKNEIIQLAKHLRLTFTHYPTSGLVTGVLLQKRQGNKLQYSVSFYDKAAEVARMRQTPTLTPLERAIIHRHVRFDVTIHSAGLLTLIGEARRLLPQLLLLRPGYLDSQSAQRFLHAEPLPTVWWLERAVGILALTTTPGCSRRSFGSWLLPQMLREVLHLDCIARFTSTDLQALAQLADPVVAAWLKAERVEDDWAGALARTAGRSPGWVYERRKQLLAQYRIDIATPYSFYRDLIFFGPNSLTRPKDRAALNKALVSGDAATNLRLRQRAAQKFDRQRISVVGGTVRRPALSISPKVAIHSQPVQPVPPALPPPVPKLAPPELGVGATKVRGSLIAPGASAAAPTIPGDEHAVVGGQQGADGPQPTPRKPAPKLSQRPAPTPAARPPISPPPSSVPGLPRRLPAWVRRGGTRKSALNSPSQRIVEMPMNRKTKAKLRATETPIIKSYRKETDCSSPAERPVLDESLIRAELAAVADEAWMDLRAPAADVIREIVDELAYLRDPRREHEDKSLARKQALEEKKG